MPFYSVDNMYTHFQTESIANNRLSFFNLGEILGNINSASYVKFCNQ